MKKSKIVISIVFAIIVLATISVIAINVLNSNPPKDVSEKVYNETLETIKIADDYLNGKASAQDLENQANILQDEIMKDENKSDTEKEINLHSANLCAATSNEITQETIKIRRNELADYINYKN